MWSFYFSVTIRLAKRKNKGKKIDEISNLGDFSDNCKWPRRRSPSSPVTFGSWITWKEPVGGSLSTPWHYFSQRKRRFSSSSFWPIAKFLPLVFLFLFLQQTFFLHFSFEPSNSPLKTIHQGKRFHCWINRTPQILGTTHMAESRHNKYNFHDRHTHYAQAPPNPPW